MSTTRPRVPRVYAAIHALSSELSSTGIAKEQINKSDGYRYRGIEDVMVVLAPLLARHRLCVLPRVLERTAGTLTGQKQSVLVSVCLKVAFDIISTRDGSIHTIAAYGEANDGSDKATAKAMTAAWKQAMLQAFCIPTGQSDPDAETNRLEGPDPIAADPVWDQWSQDVCEQITGCMTDDALSRVQAAYRDRLRILSRRRPDLFAEIGAAIAHRRGELAAEPGRPEMDTRNTINIGSNPDSEPGRGIFEEGTNARSYAC